MGLGRRLAQWWPIGILIVLAVIAALDMTGQLEPTYRWLHNHVSPEGWSAFAAWVAVAIGLVTVMVAGIYAKQQVEKAQEQVREAQNARLAQEKQSQKAIAIHIQLAQEALTAQAELNQKTLEHDAEQAQKIRREQAQPNVVLFTEMNPHVKQFLEIVVKNFGTTPAYSVKVEVEPALKATADVPGEKLIDVRIPEFPILAPGQEWRTSWDYSVGRKDYQDKWQRFADATDQELNPNEQLEKQAWLYRRNDDSTPKRSISRIEAHGHGQILRW